MIITHYLLEECKSREAVKRRQGEGLKGGGIWTKTKNLLEIGMLGDERYIQDDRLRRMMMATLSCLQSRTTKRFFLEPMQGKCGSIP